MTRRHIKPLYLLLESSRDSVWNEGEGKARAAQANLKIKLSTDSETEPDRWWLTVATNK